MSVQPLHSPKNLLQKSNLDFTPTDLKVNFISLKQSKIHFLALHAYLYIYNLHYLFQAIILFEPELIHVHDVGQ